MSTVMNILILTYAVSALGVAVIDGLIFYNQKKVEDIMGQKINDPLYFIPLKMLLPIVNTVYVLFFLYVAFIMATHKPK